MTERPTLLVVGAAIVDRHKRILLSQRPTGKMMAGMWEFPGGKVEPFEAPEAALVRELHEEINIIVQPTDLIPVHFASHAYETFHLLMPLYLVCQWHGTPEPLEGQVLAWTALEAIDTATMPPPDGPLVERVKELIKEKAF